MEHNSTDYSGLPSPDISVLDPYTLDLLDYLDNSPSNFCAVASAGKRLDRAGFKRLYTDVKWGVAAGQLIERGGRYYVVVNDSAIFAFIVGQDEMRYGLKLIAAHSDSPGLRIKPQPEMVSDGGVVKLNVEVYGGPILYTWFDRPLSLSGRVIVSRPGDDGYTSNEIVRIARPLMTIPHLAIHFNRAVNEGNPLSKQKDMLPVTAIVGDAMERENLLLKVVAAELGVDINDIVDFDLTLYDTTPACTFGVNNEFISAGRIDDLMMVHSALTSLITASRQSEIRTTSVVAIFDNEETGSGTKQGAASPVLRSILRRLNLALGGDEDDFECMIANSFMISADNAHATHPNYTEKMDPTNHPVVGGGPVIKYNANCKYMTDGASAAVFRLLCKRAGVPVQTFVNHSDIAGGSTLGNISSTQLPMRGVDMGAPQWAMHSCRETAAVIDHLYCIKAFETFFSSDYHPFLVSEWIIG